MRVIPLILLLALSAAPAWAQAQEQDEARERNPLSLTIGDEIRLYEPASDEDWVSGYVTALSDGGLGYRVEGNSQEYTRPYATIDVIQVKRRLRRESVVSGALWGVYLGAAAGVIAGPFAAKSGSMGTGTAIAAYGVAGALGGAALGATYGYVRVPPRWYRHVLP